MVLIKTSTTWKTWKKLHHHLDCRGEGLLPHAEEQEGTKVEASFWENAAAQVSSACRHLRAQLQAEVASRLVCLCVVVCEAGGANEWKVKQSSPTPTGSSWVSSHRSALHAAAALQPPADHCARSVVTPGAAAFHMTHNTQEAAAHLRPNRWDKCSPPPRWSHLQASTQYQILEHLHESVRNTRSVRGRSSTVTQRRRAPLITSERRGTPTSWLQPSLFHESCSPGCHVAFSARRSRMGK